MSVATRRTTLGPVSQSTINSRSGSAPRQSLGPARVSNAEEAVPSKRMSIGMPPMSRMSIGVAGGATRRTSVGVTRKSSLQPRSSSTGGPRFTQDPRNIGDKQFMHNSIRTLIDYLSLNNFDHPISLKILTRPAVKDFNNIIMFLFHQIDPNYTATGKFEDDVVAMFKQLGYPITISKSNISAVGSPHAWPSLLASIMWLIELLAYDEAAAIGKNKMDVNEDASDPTASEKAFYSYLANAYGLFLAGEDDKYATLEEQFVGSFESKNVLIRDQIRALEQRNIGLTNEIEEVESRRASLPELEAKKKDYLKDLGKFQQLVEQLEKHREQLTQKTEARKIELSKLTTSCTATQQECDALRSRVASQELSPEDVKNMMEEKQRLEEAQAVASEARQTLQRKVWEADMALRDKVQALDDHAKSYNRIGEDLKIVPHTARNAKGLSLGIEVDTRAKKRTGLLKTDIRSDILPALEEIRHELTTRSASLRNELLAEQDKLEVAELETAEAEEQRGVMEGKQRRADEAYRREKDALDQQSALCTKELDAMEARLIKLRETAGEEARAAHASRRVLQARAGREAQLRKHDTVKNELVSAVLEAVALCASHREMVQARLSDVKQLFGQQLETVLVTSRMGSSSVGDVLMAAAGKAKIRRTEHSAHAPASAAQPEKRLALSDQRSKQNTWNSAHVGEVLPLPQPPVGVARVVNNLCGLINECALQDQNLLDESCCSTTNSDRY